MTDKKDEEEEESFLHDFIDLGCLKFFITCCKQAKETAFPS